MEIISIIAMKVSKMSILLGIIVNNIQPVKSQTYHPFPEQNARWYQAVYGAFCGWPAACEFYEFILNGDTLVNDITYSKVYSFHEDNEGLIFKSYLGAIRNGENKKVMYLKSNSESEIILYDFDLIVNDTTTFYNGDTAIVVSLDTVLIGSEYRRRYNLESIVEIEGVYFYPYSIIEGIGSTNGLINGPNMYSGFEDGWIWLTCFWESGEVVFNPEGDECRELTAIYDYPESSNLITLFPNPCYGHLFISNVISNTTIEIFDAIGSRIIQKTIYEDTDIDISNYKNGIYFVKIIEHDKRHFHKILLIN